MTTEQIAAQIMETGMCFTDVEGAMMQAKHHVAGHGQQEKLARELVRLSAAVPERPVVWVLWIDRGAGSVAYSCEYADDTQWLSPGPHFTRSGVYETEAAVKAAVRKEEDYFANLTR
jgi:hypothetical protein